MRVPKVPKVLAPSLSLGSVGDCIKIFSEMLEEPSPYKLNKAQSKQNFDVSLRQNYISLFLPSESKKVRVLCVCRNEEKNMLG